MEMYERIRELRKNQLHLSQSEFGEILGVSRSVIANIELNTLARPEQKEPLIKLICKEFGVNENWLRTGDTPDKIFNPVSPISKAYGKFGKIMENASPQKQATLAALMEIIDIIPDEKWEYIYEQYIGCLEEARNLAKKKEEG